MVEEDGNAVRLEEARRRAREARTRFLNQWWRVDNTYWMCFRFDVYFEYGLWRASFMYGRPYPAEFDSAQAAMNYVDSLPDE